MKTDVYLRLRTISIFFFFVFFLLAVPFHNSVKAIGLGLTEDAPIMGITCGNPGATDGTEKCCAIPGETVGDQSRPFVHGNLSPFGDADGQLDAPKEKKGFLKRVTGGVGSIVKIGSKIGKYAFNPIALVIDAKKNLNDVGKGIVEAGMDVALPMVKDISGNHVSTLSAQFTNVSQNAQDSMSSVDWRCKNGIGTTEQGQTACTCKPVGITNMIPANKTAYIDWNRWILARVPQERKYAVSQVLGASTLAQQAPTQQERADFIKSCSEIMDDFDRRTCIRQAVAISPKFLSKCNKIADATEQEACKQCILGVGNEISETYGETVEGVWTGIGCVPADLGTFVSKKLLPWGIGIAGGVAMLTLIYSSYLYMTSRGNPDKLKKAKDYMNSSLIGILVIIFGVFLLQLIGITILRIPGFGS